MARYLTALMVLLLAGCQPAETALTIEKAPYPVVTQPLVTQDEYPITHRFVGRLYSSTTSQVGFELAGVVESIVVDTGKRVTQGQVLATLDDALLQSEAAQLSANLDQIEAQQSLVDATLKRQRTLESQGYQSQQQIDELLSQKNELAALAQQLSASLNANTIRRQKSRLIAPFDGVVSHRQLAPGQVVSPGQPVLTLVPEAQGEARIGVPVRLLSRLNAQDGYTVLVQGQPQPATLVGRSAEVNPVTRTVELRFALPPLDNLVNGDLVYLSVEERIPHTAARVPVSALTSGLRGRWNLMIATPSGDSYVLQRRDVTILHSDDQYAFVSGAIENDEQVVITGLQSLVAGQRVTPSVEE
ncbi:efflux RND transporter periplasmic adaptor subunit [Ferrimonas balearica]|uniref:efflux RND transporter periplasmic adaptor subunit n=1 Tax=Ferrimonas balearica TaxID=44012 RepID=UPI001C992D87|nr:efflux RND transporter periplasmic adaptor subunit [Ferrimonas balearica]MBY5922060.1 efflux RND transporter periplasmic adaptor subunit [Ferrimonas balearica]MBY5994600.1 efflux RND transporter periplasmic adaptor subunit [Ferrimonas balearica]